jgi:lysozyme family protein
MADFETAFTRTEKFEGKNVWTKIDGDSGEETWSGISRKANPKWKGWAILDKISNKKNNQVITTTELEKLKRELYKANYWDTVWGDKIKVQEVANDLYDTAVNMGVGTSIKLAQRQFKMTETSKMNDVLLAKLNSVTKL